jgi:hypothetical protein
MLAVLVMLSETRHNEEGTPLSEFRVTSLMNHYRLLEF